MWKPEERCNSEELETTIDKGGFAKLHITMRESPSLSPRISELCDLEQLDIYGGFDIPETFYAVGSKAKPRMKLLLNDVGEAGDKLYDRWLADGTLGNWEVKEYDYSLGNRLLERWKVVPIVGDFGVGDMDLRRAAIRIAGDSDSGVELPSRTRDPKFLKLLDHPTKALREKAALWLEEAFSNAIAEGTVKAQAKAVILGAPIRLTKHEVSERASTLGWTVVKKVADADVAIALAKPGPALAEAIAKGIPVVLEAHLQYAETPAPTAGSTAQGATAGDETGKLLELLQSKDAKSVRLGLTLARSMGGLEGDALVALVAQALFSSDAEVRREGRAVLLAVAPRKIVDHFQGDTRNYTAIKEAPKFRKLADTLEAAGLPAMAFLLACCDVIDGPLYRGSATNRIFEAALGVEGDPLPFYERMVNQDHVFLDITAPLPRGVGKMKSLRLLRLSSRSVKDVSAIAELRDVEGPFTIEWYLKKVGIEALAPIADKVEQLVVGFDATRDYGVLARLTKLRRLSMGGYAGPLRDLSPLAGLPLERLSLDGQPFSDLSPLRSIKTLRALEIKNCSAVDPDELSTLAASLPKA